MKTDQILFLLRHFDEFDPKINVLSRLDRRKETELFVCNKHGLHGGHCLQQKCENCTKITSTAKSAR